MTREGGFSNADDLLALREEIRDEKNRDDANDAKLKEIVAELNGIDCRLILCSKNIGAWLNVWGTMEWFQTQMRKIN